MPMLLLLGANHRLPLFYMAKCFIWINDTKNCINEFTIGYMINVGLNFTKAFKYQVGKCIITTFDEITKPFIKSTFAKKYKCIRIINTL